MNIHPAKKVMKDVWGDTGPFMDFHPVKEFMEDVWGAEGDFIDTPLGRGRIENVRTKAGIDLEVMVKIPNIDGFTLFSGLKLFEFHASK